MFSIIISEKGGAERRETFDKDEINIGRVQGNELMLPKGNVSKRHARLVFRDDRYIVTDLKSTNGTYVNGRRIAQATIIREGDKVYIGDFVIRVDTGGELASVGAPPMRSEAAGEADHGAPPAEHEAVEAPRPAAGPSTMQPPPPFAPNPSGAPLPAPGSAASAPDAQAAGTSSLGPAPGASLAGAPGMPNPIAPPHAGASASPFAPGRPLPLPREPGPSLGPAPSPAASYAPMPVPAPAAAPPSPGASASPQPLPAAPFGAPVGASRTLGGVISPRLTTQGLGAVPTSQPPDGPVGAQPGFAGARPGMPPPRSGGPGAPPTLGAAAAGASAPLTPPHAPLNPASVARSPIVPTGPGTADPGAVPAGAAAPSAFPAPPNVPGPLFVASAGLAPQAPSALAVSAAPTSSASPTATPLRAGASTPPASAPVPSPRHSVKSAASHEDVVEASQAAAHRHALRRLVASACEGLDLRALLLDPPPISLVAQLDQALAARARELESRGESAGVAVEVLIAEARRELFELGPVGPLLEDDDVEEIQILGHDHVLAIHDHKQIATELAFTTEDAVRRAIHRLCASAGAPIEAGARFVERRLPSGARLHAALAPEAAGAHVVTLKKPHGKTTNFDELVRTGALSRSIAMMLSAIVRHRANVLLVGSPSSGVGDVIHAHVSASAPEERVVVLDNDGRFMARSMPHAVTIDVGGAEEVRREAVRLTMHIAPDRLVVPSLTRGLASAVVGMVSEGLGGIIACSPAPTLRHALSRLPAELGVEHPTLSATTAGDWLANTFDLVVEVARLADGRPRIVRIAELSSQSGVLEARDVFVYSPSDPTAGPEGHFHPTGHVPSVVEELLDREGGLDRSIFDRVSR